MSAKDSKKKEALKEFTVGSVKPPSGSGKAKKSAPAAKIEVSENEFPLLAGMIKGGNTDAFKKEVGRVLSMVQASRTSEKSAAERVERAYAMALAILDSGKVVK